MSEAISLESFVSELASADQPEQPIEDSSPVTEPAVEEGQPEAEAQAEGQPEAEAEAGEQPETDSPDDRVIKWQTAAGETYEVTEKELRDGYLRQQDYTHKQQTLAEERRQAQTQIQQQAQLVTALAGDIGELQAVNAQLQQYQALDWNALQAQDPAQHTQLMTQYLALKERHREAQGKVSVKAQQMQAEQANQFRQQSMEAFEHLKTRIPGFSEKTLADMRDACLKAGYRPDELGVISHKLLLEDLWKARQYDALQSKKPEVQNKVKALPPATAKKPAAPSVPSTKLEQVSKAIQNKRAFSVQDFAQLMKATKG